jgi:hypothetical protein
MKLVIYYNSLSHIVNIGYQIVTHTLRETFYLNVSNAHQIVRQKTVRVVTPLCLYVRASVYRTKTPQKIGAGFVIPVYEK